MLSDESRIKNVQAGLDEIHSPGVYKVLSYFKLNNIHRPHRVSIMHEVCKHTFTVDPYDVVGRKNRPTSKCPKCFIRKSHGEKRISDFLKDNDFDYVCQFKTPECKNINVLSCDFAVFFGSNLKILIEFNGKQHYEIIDYFGGKKFHEDMIKRDEIKKKYCKANNIKLITIHYKQFKNIEHILRKALL